MKYLLILLITAICTSLGCQRDLHPGQIGRLLGPEKQHFTITPGQDTIIRCKGGMVLRFCPNTFVTAEKKVVLEVQEVQDRGEAFLLGISTLAADGRLLETEGMVYLDATTANGSEVSINPDCPVQLELPARGRRAGARWFRGGANGPDITWTEVPGGLDNQTAINTLATGGQLFQTLCTPCHCSNLSVLLTGPSLGNITRFRDKNWLRQFTRNSQKLIASGDSLANCLWDTWKPTMMSNFTQLSDTQIDAIYQFIEEESARLNVQLDSKDFACLPYEGHIGVDSASRVAPLLPVPKTNPYFAKIYNLGWYNCDLFAVDTTAQPAVIKVTVLNGDQFDELLVGVLLDQLNANIRLTNYSNNNDPFATYPNTILPQVPARIVVLGIQGKKWFQYEQPFTIGPDNVFTATMQATTSQKIKAFVQANEFREPQVAKYPPCTIPIFSQ